MKKQTAIALLGGSVAAAARNLGCSTQAVYKWPDDGPLPRAVADRVIATRVRMRADARKQRGKVLDPLEEDALSIL